MKSYNLNSVRIPVGYWYFHELSNYTTAPYLLPEESIFDAFNPITKIIRYAFNADLQVILDLHGGQCTCCTIMMPLKLLLQHLVDKTGSTIVVVQVIL
jgi:aryl-phospho-beta-D-glucosidase BglC (GH1 family)